ncbi:MAG: O-antigen ligase family protein [Desulfobulbaceae bacterium]|nr:O-antigen ligase family protein [Desulfobulbaceae bacterium]
MEPVKYITPTKKLSFPFLLLCLFTISNYFMPTYYLGEAFSRLPLILVSSAAVTYVIFRVVRGEPLFAPSPAMFCLLAVYLFAVFSTYGLSVDVQHSKEYLANFTKSIILFFIISHVVTNEKEFKTYLIVLACCAFGIAYKLVHYPVWNYGRADVYGSVLVADPNGQTIVFIYSLIITGALIFLIQSKLARIALCYFVFTFLLGIVEAQSRGGFLALLISVGVWLLQIKNKRHRCLAVLFIIPFTILFTFRYVPPNYISRMGEITRPEADVTGSAEHRLNAMNIAFNYLVSHPFSEYGLGNHSYLIAKAYNANELIPDDIFRGKFLAHNLFLQYGADSGFIPLMFYLLFIFFIFYTLSRDQRALFTINTRESMELVVIAKTLRICLCGFLAGAFFLPWAYAFYLFYISGLCAVLHQLTKNQSTRHGKE